MEHIQLLPIIIILIAMLAVLYLCFRKGNKPLESSENKLLANEEFPEADPLEVEKYRHLIPLRIQAGERLVLLLERIHPQLLIQHNLNLHSNANALAQAILYTIREEFEHNLSQQIYVSETAWQMLVTAKEEMIQLVHLANAELDEEASANDLARKMLMKEPPKMLAQAIAKLREDVYEMNFKN